MIQLTIPIAGEQELEAYKKAILGVLSKIAILNCDEVLLENVKSVYKLLGHLNDDSRISGLPKHQNQGT